jgi:hypothetical protein
MLAPRTVQRHQDIASKPRWAVWVDGHRPTIVSSKSQAKKLCARAKNVGYFCRWCPSVRPDETLISTSISDFLVWQLGSEGGFFCFMYLLPVETLMGSTTGPFGFAMFPADRLRYERALSNSRVWKLGGTDALKAFGGYPAKLAEVTADSDAGMTCAGYRCIGEVSTIVELHAVLSSASLAASYCGTVGNASLKLWVEEAD